MFAMNWPNYPGDGITLRQNRSTSHLEQFDDEHPAKPKPMLATNCAKHPGDGITRRQNHSTNHLRTRARSERPPARPEKYTEVLGESMSKQNFRFLKSSKKSNFSNNFRLMGHRCLATYNFFISQRPELILWQNKIQ